MTDISCGVVYETTLVSLVLFQSYCYVALKLIRNDCLLLFIRNSHYSHQSQVQKALLLAIAVMKGAGKNSHVVSSLDRPS